MGISYYLAARGVSLGEPSRKKAFAIRNFHNLYLYQNENLDFPYVNKNVPYAELTEEEKDNELFILIPIFSSIGHPIGDIDYDTGTVTLDAEVRSALKEIQKRQNDISGKKRAPLEAYSKYRVIDKASAKRLGLVYKVDHDAIEITDFIGESDTFIVPKTIDGIPVKSISNVNEKAFSKIVVLADLETIQSFSLHNCRSLKSLFVDGSLGLIGQGVFDNSKLEKTISNDVQYLSLNGNPFYLALSYVGGFPSCIVLNENCISIIERAFCNLGVYYMGASSV